MIRKAIWITLAVLAIGLSAWLFWPRPAQVKVIAIQAQEASRILAVNGHVRPRLSVEVKPPVAGRVIFLSADVGQRVEQGALLARIDDAPELAAIRQAESLLTAQREVLAQALRDRGRYERLADIVGSQRVEQARLAARQAQDEVQRLTAVLRQAREVQARHQILAPFAGVIAERPVDPGQTVGSDTVLYRLVDISKPQVTADVDELYAADLSLGMAAQIAIPGMAGVMDARIVHIEERVDPATGARTIRLNFDQPPATLPAGLTVAVNLMVERRKNAVSIPRSAILSPGSNPRVRVVTATGDVREQAIRFVDWPSKTVIVSDGLAPGMRILADPLAAQPGQHVRIAD